MKEDYMAGLRFAETPPKRYEVDQRPATLLEKVQYWFRRGYWVKGLKITSYREVPLVDNPAYHTASHEEDLSVNDSWFTPNDVY